MATPRSLGRFLLVAGLGALAGSHSLPHVNADRPSVAAGKPAQIAAVKGLQFRLSHGEAEGPERGASTPPPATEPLGDAEIEKLLARLPALATEADDVKSFALRDRSLPAPRTGSTHQTPFPPATDRERPDVHPESSGPLRVLRH